MIVLETRSLVVALAMCCAMCPRSSARDDATAWSSKAFAPTAFVANEGQWEPGILFAASVGGGAVQVRRDGLYFGAPGDHGLEVIRLGIGHGDLGCGISPSGPAHTVNMYGAHRRSEGLAGFTKLEGATLEPGVDLHLATEGDRIAFRVDVAVDAAIPSLPIDGPTAALDADRGLRWIGQSHSLALRLTEARSGGVSLAARAVVEAMGEASILVDDWDRTSPLTITGDLAWSTFFGGSLSETLEDMTVLDDGRVLVVGNTASLDFPITPNAAMSEFGASMFQAFVSMISADGSELIYSTFLWSDDPGGVLTVRAVARHGGSRVAIAGECNSLLLPATPRAFQSSYGGGVFDGFVAEFDLVTGALTYATYVGGSASDRLQTVAYTPTGLIVAGGNCFSPEFPTTPGVMQPVKAAFFDGLIVILDPSAVGASQLVASTFLGGSTNADLIETILATDDDLVIAGWVATDFPLPPGGVGWPPTPGTTLFIARVPYDLSGMTAAACWGGVIAVNSLGEIGWALGHISMGVLDADLASMQWSSVLTGSENQSPNDVALDDAGNLIVTGNTSSPDFPTTAGAIDTEYSGGLADPFVSVITNHGTTLSYSTFLGGSGAGAAWGDRVETFSGGDFVVAGRVGSSDFPVTAGAFDETPNNIFVTHFDLDLTWTPLGNGLAGSAGLPTLTGSGTMQPGNPTTLTVKRAKASSTAWLVIGAGLLEAPFKQGTLVPSPDLVVGGIPIGANGVASLTFNWPRGLPSGLATFYQVWVADPAAPAGLSATNGLQGLTP